MAKAEVLQPRYEGKDLLKIRDECGIVGCYSRTADIPTTLFNGLVELNHRGQEGAGMVIANGQSEVVVKDSGLAGVVFGVKHDLPYLKDAVVGIGHDRYSTSGSCADVQPFTEGNISIAHNGNLTNISTLRAEFDLPDAEDGATSDTRAALAIINRMPGSPREKILAAQRLFEGAYCFVLSTKDTLFASRDPRGFRPLSIGKVEKGDGYVVASESSAFPSMGARLLRDVRPGETIMVNEDGLTTIGLETGKSLSQCIFELIYISRIDSTVFGIPISEYRSRQGEILARKLPDVDLIMPVPRSGIGAALGVAASEAAHLRGIPYKEGLYTNPYMGIKDGPRTFIKPDNREKAAAEKYSSVEAVVKGKRLAIVDDSVVRGSMKTVTQKLRAAGAIEVHALVASPPLRHPCRFGVDMATYEEFHANKFPDLPERLRDLGLDSLTHLTYSETIEAALGNRVDLQNEEAVFESNGFCGACFTGRYPIEVDGVIPKQ